MNHIYAVILAGGHGIRAGKQIPKQFLNINGIPVIVYTINKFAHSGLQINGTIIAVPEDYIEHTEKLITKYRINGLIKIIKGGDTRQGSSYNVLNCHKFDDDDILVFHDAARPFIDPKTINECIKKAQEFGSCGVYIKATDTIAMIENDFVKQIHDRSKLYYTQTPQAFRYRIIREAHELAISKGVHDPTDDIQLVLDAGNKVGIVEGSSTNIKITGPFDLELAEFIAGKESKN